MSYTALYRKFRPVRFDEVRGQDAIVTTLKNQLHADRLGHAYLFCGTRGTGKTTIAKILARAVNCEHPTEDGPCNECPTCRAILAGTSTNVIEIDAASNNGVDNIREIREEVTYRPTAGRFKVYIIDEVHMLSAGAFNALLKTLEEPPAYVLFILATTEANKIPVTILSRCQRYDFRRIPIETIAGQIQALLEAEDVEAEPRAIRYIARKADGSMRDALSLLDQCIAFYLGDTLTFDKVLEVLGTVDTDTFSRLLRAVIHSDAARSIRILEELVRQGKEMGQFVSDFTWYMRNLMLLQSNPELEDVLDVSSENLEQLREESEMVEPAALMRFIRIFSELSGTLRQVTQRRVLVETTLIKLCRPEMNTNREAILQRLRKLEQAAESGPAFSQQEIDLLHRLAANPEAFAAGRQPAGGAPYTAGSANGGAYGAYGNSSVPGYGNAPAGVYGSGSAGGYGAGHTAPPKAAPEDLKKIRENWNKIIGMTGMPLQGYLRQAVPQYDPSAEEPKLLLCFRDPMAKLFFEQKEHMDELQEAIMSAAGKEAEVEIIIESETAGRGYQTIAIDQVLEQIDMTVEEEDSDDDF